MSKPTPTLIRLGTRLLPIVLTASLLVGAGLTRAQTPAEDPERSKQIAEVQKQINELNKKLDELKAPKKAGAIGDNALKIDDWSKALNWRSLGPAAMGGRITAISVFEGDSSLWYVGTASSGLLKTTNHGITFEYLFDKEATVSIGDVAVAPSNKDIVWIGTGEANPRNSVSWGDGVYKSTDGGKTWKNMGLKETLYTGKIVIHPKDPNIVYVGALGRLYAPNPDRGLYKTTDGGATWKKILHVDDRTGVVDMRMSPADPEALLVATYERERDAFDVNEPAKRNGPGSGIHRTTDGGKTWKKITKGLPTSNLGRIGLDWYKKDPRVVYAVLESEKTGLGPATKKSATPKSDPSKKAEPSKKGEPEKKAEPAKAATPPAGNAYLGVTGDDAPASGAVLDELVPNGPADKSGLKSKDIVVNVGGVKVATYEALVAEIRKRKAGEQVKFLVTRDNKPVEVLVTFEARPAGLDQVGSMQSESGASLVDPGRPFGSMLAGQIENAQDRQGTDGFEYGGVYRSDDAGESWTRINSLTPRPMYFSQIRVDPTDNNYLYVLGVALHRSTDGGKTFRGDGGRNVHADHHALWIDPKDPRHLVLGCDGGIYASFDRSSNWDHYNHVAIGQFYHVAIDSRRPFKVYGGLQDNGSWGGPDMVRSGQGALNEDWMNVGMGDGFKCQVDPSDPDQIYYTSQNGALGRRNLRTGEGGGIRPRPEQGKRFRFNWNTPFILANQNPKIYYAAGNYVFRSLNKGDDLRIISPDITKSEKGTATALSESPRDPNVLYAGTDDGNLWITKDGGKAWTELSGKLGLKGPRHVSSIEASRHADGRVYVAFDGHRSDEYDPLVYVSEDFGQTWKSIRANLPTGSSKTLREDRENPDLLYLGTEFAAWASIDRGTSWAKINGSTLPTVAVFEYAQHPTLDVVAVATHGRSLWVLEVGALRQATRAAYTAKAFLAKPDTAIRFRSEVPRGLTNRKFVGQNPFNGAVIYYGLSKKAEKIALKILDIQGNTVRDLRPSVEAGLHRLTWDLNGTVPGGTGQGGARRGGGGRGMFGGFGGGNFRPVPAGSYRLLLTVDGQEFSQPLLVQSDPAYPEPSSNALEAEEESEDEEAMAPEEREEREMERRAREGEPEPKRPID